MTFQYHLYVSDRGNVFMREIAALLAAAISDLGYSAIFPTRGLPEPAPNRANLVIAPHEFFPLQPDYYDDATLLRAAENSVILGVEQPGTEWFELGAHYSSAAPLVLDISSHAIRELRRRGLEPIHLQLGYHRSWDRWGGDPARARSTDVLFLGAMTDRRASILSQGAPILLDYAADIRLFEFRSPITQPRHNFVAFQEKWDLLASSRVLMNIHRNDEPYFEWVRALEAIANGCLVVSETSSDYGPLIPGDHLVVAPADAVCAHTAAVLADEALRVELTSTVYDFVRTNLDLPTLLAPLCAQIEELSQRGVRRARRPAGPPISNGSNGPSNPLLSDAVDREMRVLTRVRHLIDNETKLIQHVEGLQALLVHGDAEHTLRTATSAWENFSPQVSVIITCYNYRDFVLEAMESAMCSDSVEVELIVVDDHSGDGSSETIAEAIATWSLFPILFLSRCANGGLSVARCQAIAESRADRIFILDADNRIFPTALRKLSAALDATPEAAFSYGLIAQLGEPGLVSAFPWDVTRLTVSNYIDAMAMIRRSVWEEFGGYDPDLRGWEDYEFWLRLAAAGRSGAFVPDFVGQYRVHPGSMLETVNTEPLMRRFRELYPFLPWTGGL